MEEQSDREDTRRAKDCCTSMASINPPTSTAGEGQPKTSSPPALPANKDDEAAPRLPSETTPPPPTPPKTVVSLHDIVRATPLEEEAETCILEALEQRDPLHAAANTQDDNLAPLLEQVPEGTEAVFDVLDDGDEEDDDTAPNRDNEPDNLPLTSTIRSGVSGDSSTRRTSRRETKRKHRHTPSVEDTLFGLTTALSAMQVLDSHDTATSPGASSRVPPSTHHPRLPDDHDAMGATTLTDVADTIPLLHRRGRQTTTVVTVDADGSVRLAAASNPQADNPLAAAEMGTATPGGGTNESQRIPSTAAPDPATPSGTTDATTATNGGSPATGATPWYYHGSRMTQPLFQYLQEKTIAIQDVRTFWGQKRKSLVARLRIALVYFVLPVVATAAALFYVGDNPPTGRIDVQASQNGTALLDKNGNTVNADEASASWWLLFLTRHFVVLGLAKGTEIVLIDFFCLGVKWASVLWGPFLTLLIVQSRGWPFLATMWSIYSLLLLYGDKRFSRHWLYFQDAVDVFNEVNPSGRFVHNDLYYRVLLIVLCVGPIVTLKRLYLGLSLGRKSFATYADDLASVMRKVLVVTQVAALARHLEFQAETRGRADATFQTQLRSIYEQADEDDSKTTSTRSAVNDIPTQPPSNGLLLDPANRSRATGGLSAAQKAKIATILGDWEEPAKEAMAATGNISIRSILQFRQSVAFLDTSYIFGVAFGMANTRGRCIESSQQLYKRFLLDDKGSATLRFETIAQMALRADGTLDEEKTNSLVRLFRPDRKGNLSLLDFVKSVDSVYKEARLLRASIRNSRRLDKAFEGIISIFFYILMWAVILAVLGIDPLALFLAFSPVILAFTFMFGGSAAKFFEGILFVLIRKPYEIGDRINISSPSSSSSPGGSPGWVVTDITLFHTTVVYGTTNERATISNGSLAGTRVLNMARSPRALIYVYVKFGIDVEHDKIGIFEEALRKFVLARPREWLNFLGFRITKFEADAGYQEYIIILQHRESWQNIGALLQSKANVSAFCLELSKKMDMRYKSPVLPVDLSLSTQSTPLGTVETETQGRATRTVEESRSILSEFGAAGPERTSIAGLAALFAQKKNE